MVLILFHPAILSVVAVRGFGNGASGGRQTHQGNDATQARLLADHLGLARARIHAPIVQ